MTKYKGNDRFFWCRHCQAFYTEKAKVCWSPWPTDKKPTIHDSGRADSYTAALMKKRLKIPDNVNARQLPDLDANTVMPVNPTAPTADGVHTSVLNQFKLLLVSQNDEKIRNAVIDMWPNNQEGLLLRWGNGELIIGGLGLTPTTRACGEALREYVIKNILHPVMYKNADLDQAIARINLLAGDNHPKNYGIFGSGQSLFTPHAFCVALCLSQGDAPDHHGLTVNGNEDASELETYVGKCAGEGNLLTGQLPFKIRVLENKGLLGKISFGLIAVCAVGYIIYKQCCAENEEDNEENALDEEDTAQSNQINGGPNEVK